MKIRELSTKELILTSVAILLFAGALFIWMKGTNPSDLGSLLGASSSLIAVIWFYRGLRLQSLQISEQRDQFARQFDLQHQDSRLAFLESSSKRMKTSLEELLTSLNISNETEVMITYLNTIPFYKLATESTDPHKVISEIQEWTKIEAPCGKFLATVRDIVILYKLRLGMEDDSERIDVAEYVYINSGHLMKQPFMSSYRCIVSTLSEQMNLLYPGRNAMYLASSAALALIAPAKIMNTDKIIEDINAAKSDGKFIPAICYKFLEVQQVS